MRSLSLRVLALATLALPLFGQADGTLDAAFVPPNLTYGQVNKVVRQSDGKFLVAGDFTLANGTFSSCLARFNADGTLDTAFTANLGTGFDGTLVDLIQTSTGKILCLGAYGSFNGTLRNQMAQLNSDGTLDTSWDVGALLNATTTAAGGGFPNAVILLAGDKLVVVGNFNSVGATLTPRNNIARFNADGTHDLTFDPGTGLKAAGNPALPPAGATMIRAGSQLYVQAACDTYNDVSCPAGYVRISLDGALDPTFNVASGTDPYVVGAGLAFADSSGRAYVTGSFGSFNGVARRDIVRLALNGTVDPTFNAGAIPGGSGIPGASITAADKIYIAGGFNSINGTARRSFARLNTDGSLDTTFAPGSGATNGYGNFIQELPDGRVFCGGGFAQFDGVARGSMAITSGTGVLDGTFVTSPGLTRGNSFVAATAMQPDGKLLVGGFFSYSDSAAKQSLIRLNPDGTLDATFNPGGVGGDNSCRAIILRPDGKIYVCGQFRSWNNVPRLRIARLNSDGTLDTGFDPALGLDNAPFALAEQPDGGVVVVGLFTTANGLQRNGIARFLANGTVDPAFNPGTGFGFGAGYSVFAVGLQSTGKIVVGGAFSGYNGVPKANLVRLNTDGTLDTSFVTTANSNVRAITVLASDKIYLGGQFNQLVNVTPFTRQRVARLNADGTVDSAFNVTPGTTSMLVRALLPLSNGQLYIAGSGGTVVAGQTRRLVARLTSTGTLDTTFDPGTAGGTYLYGTTTPFVGGLANAAALAVLPTDGSLFVGGSFQTWNGLARTHIVKLNALPYETFLATNFTAAERANAAISGDTADPDGDGLGNLAEFAFNKNPRVGNNPNGVPTTALVNNGGSFANEITFPRRLFTPGITYIVETSSDLTTWTQGATQGALGVSDGITQLVTFRDNTPLSLTDPKRFIRVRVTRP